ncbi:MAG: hypothetical protein ACLGIN_15060 [Candidatus Sericytochromatia bacterium]
MNRITRQDGTGPLNRGTQPLKAPTQPLPAPKPAGPTLARDRNGTGPLAAEALKALEVQAPAPKAPPKEEKGGFWGSVGKFFDRTGDVVKKVADVAGDAVDATLDGVGAVADSALDLAGEAAGEALKAMGHEEAGKKVARTLDRAGDKVNQAFDVTGNVANQLVDSAGTIGNTVLDVTGGVIADGPLGAATALADGVLGPEKPEFKGQMSGFTGAIANRLGVGDSVFIRADVGAEVGAGVFVGGELTGGAMLSRLPDGKLLLSLDMGVEANFGLKAEAGFTVNGVGAKAKAEASIGAAGEAKMDLVFDPANPQEAARLQALLEPKPEKLAAAAINPLGAASISGSALKDAMKHHLKSIEYGGEGKATASAKARGSIQAAAGEIGVSAKAVAGVNHKIDYTDQSTKTTYFINAGVELKARAGAKGSPVSADAALGARFVRSVEVEKDAAGNMTGLAGEFYVPVTARAGVGRMDVHGDAKTSFGVSHSESTKIKLELTPEAFAEAQQRIAAGENTMSVFLDLADDPGKSTAKKTTITSDTFRLGFEVDLALGAKVGAEASLTLGKGHRSGQDLEEIDLLEMGLIQGRK